jgi:hypothetical protein
MKMTCKPGTSEHSNATRLLTVLLGLTTGSGYLP